MVQNLSISEESKYYSPPNNRMLSLNRFNSSHSFIYFCLEYYAIRTKSLKKFFPSISVFHESCLIFMNNNYNDNVDFMQFAMHLLLRYYIFMGSAKPLRRCFIQYLFLQA